MKKMKILATVILVIFGLVGFGIIDKNVNGEPFKHSELMGLLGYVLVISQLLILEIWKLY